MRYGRPEIFTRATGLKKHAARHAKAIGDYRIALSNGTRTKRGLAAPPRQRRDSKIHARLPARRRQAWATQHINKNAHRFTQVCNDGLNLCILTNILRSESHWHVDNLFAEFFLATELQNKVHKLSTARLHYRRSNWIFFDKKTTLIHQSMQICNVIIQVSDNNGVHRHKVSRITLTCGPLDRCHATNSMRHRYNDELHADLLYKSAPVRPFVSTSTRAN